MNNKDKFNLIKAFAKTIFASKEAQTDITKASVMHPAIVSNNNKAFGRWFLKGTLRGFDVVINDGTQITTLRILEQNPNKTDAYGNLKENAIMARAGHKIIWIIRKETKEYLGKLQYNPLTKDYDWTPNTPRGIQKQIRKPGPVPGTYIAQNTQPQTIQTYHTPTEEDIESGVYDYIPEIEPQDVMQFVGEGEWE